MGKISTNGDTFYTSWGGPVDNPRKSLFHGVVASDEIKVVVDVVSVGAKSGDTMTHNGLSKINDG